MEYVARLMDHVGILSWNVSEICWKLTEHVGILMGYLRI